MTRQRVVAVIVLVSVFALGALTGVFVERHRSVASTGELSVAEIHRATMDELREVLDLDDQQIEQIHAVLADRQQLVQHAWEQFRPEVQAAIREVHVEIATLLRPDQIARYHEWLSRNADEPLPNPRH